MTPAILRSQARRNSKPNILFLVDDQHRGDCTRADGNRAIHTPNIDRLGNEGARFRHAYSTTPACTPARSALLTGLSPWNHGMLHMVAMAQQYPYTKPRALRDAGYYTMGIGKMHYHPQRNSNWFHPGARNHRSFAVTTGPGSPRSPVLAQPVELRDTADIDLEHGVYYSRENNWNASTDGGVKYIFQPKNGS